MACSGLFQSNLKGNNYNVNSRKEGRSKIEFLKQYKSDDLYFLSRPNDICGPLLNDHGRNGEYN